MDMYYGSLSYVLNFIIKELPQQVTAMGDMLDLHMWPYGTAKTNYDVNGRFEIECENGWECVLNVYHACANKYIKDNDLLMKYISCLYRFIFLYDLSGVYKLHK